MDTATQQAVSMDTKTQQEMRIEINQCIQNCLDSHRSCLETVAYCLQVGGEHTNSAFINLLMDCATICAANANFMIRNSTFHSQTCGICAAICNACAAACQKLGPDDPVLQQCESICGRSGESCWTMS